MQRETGTDSEWFDAALVVNKPSRLSGIIFVLLCLIPIFSCLAYGAVETWALAVNLILIGLAGTAWMSDAALSGGFRYSSNLLQLPLLGLIAIGVIQLLPLSDPGLPKDLLSANPTHALTLDPNATTFAVIRFIVFFIFFAAALTFLDSQKRLRRMVLVIIIFASAMAFFGIIQKLSNTDSIYWLRSAPSIPFASYVNQHHFAAFMEMTIGLTLGLLYGEATKKDKRLLLIIAVGLMGIAILLTGSRGGLLSLLGVIGFVTILNLMGKKQHSFEGEESSFSFQNKFVLIGSGFALLLILVGGIVFIGGDSALLRGTGLEKQADITTGRSHFWQIALQSIRDNPIIGTGLDSFAMTYPKYDTWNGAMRVEQAHNDYLQILSDAGILGFLCIAIFTFFLFKKSLNNIARITDRFRRGVVMGSLAGCFGILVHSFFDFPLRTSANGFFFLLLVAMATGSLNYPKLYKPGVEPIEQGE